MSSGMNEAAREERAQREIMRAIGSFVQALQAEGIGMGFSLDPDFLAEINEQLEEVGLEIQHLRRK